MIAKYCVDCEHIEKRPIMAETHMDSGEYIQTGYYYKCKECGAVFHQSAEEMEFQHCVNG